MAPPAVYPPRSTAHVGLSRLAARPYGDEDPTAGDSIAGGVALGPRALACSLL